MFNYELVQYLAENVRQGQAELAQTVRSLLTRRASDLIDFFKPEHEAIFLEPALFAWLTAHRDDIDLQQILYAYLPEAARPSRLRLAADAQGIAHLPRLGYVAGLTPLQQTEVIRQGEANNWVIVAATNTHPLQFIPARFAAAGLLELTYNMDPVLWPLFAESKNPHAATIAAHEITEIQTLFDHALTLMRQVRPDIYHLLCMANRRVHLYQAEAPNSFATLSMHGAAFLNRIERPSTLFFLDDFAHQGGHVVFNAATLNHDRFLTIDPTTPLSDFLENSNDQRSLYAAFHGLFTYSLIVSVLLASLHRHILNNQQTHEARGRLGFYLLKFQCDLQNLAQPKLYTAEGVRLYRGFHECYESAIATYAIKLRELDYSNQPYVFHYGRFNELNPLIQPVSARKKESLQ